MFTNLLFLIRWIGIISLAIIPQLSLRAQTPPVPELDLQAHIQELFPVQSEDVNYEEVFETLSQLVQAPLDINRASLDDLLSLLALSPEQAMSILQHRIAYGPYLSLYELQSVQSLSLDVIKKILPFITLGERSIPLHKSFKSPTQHYALLRGARTLQPMHGFSPLDSTSRAVTRYRGDPWQLYGRYRYARPGAYSIGLTLDKDVGEKLSWHPSKRIYGVDFVSFHFQVNNRRWLRNFIIGDFQLHAGQGLTFASGFSLGKSTEVIHSVLRNSPTLRPYTSITEYGFFRGISATIRLLPNWHFTPLLAHNNRTATLARAGTVFPDTVITSFPTDGYHRTPTEWNKKANSSETNAGWTQTYQFSSRLTLNQSLLWTRYQYPIEKRNLPYNAWEFKGSDNHIFSLGIQYKLPWAYWVSELARSKSGGIGIISGWVGSFSKRWDWSLLIRNYQRNFHSFYGNPFKESSRPINERGGYWGTRFTPSRQWQYSAYVDYFQFPYRRFQADTSSYGFGTLIHVRWRPSRNFQATSMYQMEQKQENNNTPSIPLIWTRRQVAMISGVWEKRNSYTIRTRLQATSHQTGDAAVSHGIALIQDASFYVKKIELSGRIALFNAETYDSRQYMYEKDVLYAFSLPTFYNQGTRHYLMVRFPVSPRIRVWVRWAHTQYTDIDTISSGLNQINGSKRSDIKGQLVYSF